MLDVTGKIAPERTVPERIFHQRYERFLARVNRHIASRLDDGRAIESLVEGILAETIDDWMGPGEDVARAARVLARSRSQVASAGSERD
jgi:hypothetical protein